MPWPQLIGPALLASFQVQPDMGSDSFLVWMLKTDILVFHRCQRLDFCLKSHESDMGINLDNLLLKMLVDCYTNLITLLFSDTLTPKQIKSDKIQHSGCILRIGGGASYSREGSAYMSYLACPLDKA